MDYPDATVVPIVGARTVEQLDENVGAADVTLSDDQWDRIFEARYDDEGRRFGHRE
jgi:aryl-alcohol dehydrogenase-like predicted oxidoreductase